METKNWYSNSDSSYEAKAWRERQRWARQDRLAGRTTKVAATPTPTTPAAPKTYRCRHCGQTGRAGEYPFSTIAGGDVCDDCL